MPMPPASVALFETGIPPPLITQKTYYMFWFRGWNLFWDAGQVQSSTLGDRQTGMLWQTTHISWILTLNDKSHTHYGPNTSNKIQNLSWVTDTPK